MSTRRHGFSLIELLVVLTIVGLLVGLTLAGVQRARDAAARARCQNNLRQLALGLHQYHDRHAALPPGHTAADGRPGTMRLSWHARVLPYVEQGPLWETVLEAYKTDPKPHTSDHPPHRAIQQTPVPVFACPADRGPSGMRASRGWSSR
jgi:prepilin-type N-terminal cleavage/methylation domain-containing protein